jgi:hypothetical protein
MVIALVVGVVGVAIAIVRSASERFPAFGRLAGFRSAESKASEQPRSQGRARSKQGGADWSWQGTALKLFYVTATLAFLTLLGVNASATTAAHFSSAILFTDLTAVGTLLSGVAATVVCIFGFRNKQKSDSQPTSFTAEVINQVLELKDGPPTAEEIKALADLARALNNDQGDNKQKRLEIEGDSAR